MSAPVSEVYDVLVECCGATDDESMRLQFAAFWERREESREFRFIGDLGFGGKLWARGNPACMPYVTCYREHETPERLAMIADADAAFRALWAVTDTEIVQRATPKVAGRLPAPEKDGT